MLNPFKDIQNEKIAMFYKCPFESPKTGTDLERDFIDDFLIDEIDTKLYNPLNLKVDFENNNSRPIWKKYL